MKKLVIVFALLMLASCATHIDVTSAINVEPVGFWHGLWHGFIAPIAWLVSLFSESTAIYAVCNSGGWYDFGFMLGIGALSSGASSSSRK